MQTNLVYSVESITPEIASKYLASNTMNRPVHNNQLKFYEYLMKNDKWQFDASSPITFAEDGTLLNGQHRLKAVENTQKTIVSAVLRGADKSSFATMDTGANRTGADILALAHYANSTIIAGIINLFLTLKKGFAISPERGSAPSKSLTFTTNEDILIEYESSPDFYQTIGRFAYREYKKYRLYTTAQIGAISTLLIKEKHHDIAKVEEFFNELNDGTTYPYLKDLRRKIIVSKEKKTNKLSAQAKMVLLSKAWNYFINGEDRKVLLYRLGDKVNFE